MVSGKQSLTGALSQNIDLYLILSPDATMPLIDALEDSLGRHCSWLRGASHRVQVLLLEATGKLCVLGLFTHPLDVR